MSQMNEPLREMVSAVVDGEASEFELRRVLDGCEDAAVGALLARHFAVRSVLRGETAALCPSQVSTQRNQVVASRVWFQAVEIAPAIGLQLRLSVLDSH